MSAERMWHCGGGCGALLPRAQVCCQPCWQRAPHWLRQRYRNTRDADPWTTLQGGVELIRWFRTHPPRTEHGALRGTCAICRLDVVLRLDNTLRQHGGGYGRRPCAGSRRTPLCTVA